MLTLSADDRAALLRGATVRAVRAVEWPIPGRVPDFSRAYADHGGTSIWGPGPYLKVPNHDPDTTDELVSRVFCPWGYPPDCVRIGRRSGHARICRAALRLESGKWWWVLDLVAIPSRPPAQRRFRRSKPAARGWHRLLLPGPVWLSVDYAIGAGHSNLADSVLVMPRGDRFLLAVVDGASGMTGAAEAADAVLSAIRQNAHAVCATPTHLDEMLRSIDRDLASRGGAMAHVAAIAVVACAGDLYAASAGDCEARFLTDDGWADLVEERRSRKPLLGSGNARPAMVGPIVWRGPLVVGSDGFWNHAGLSVVRERLPDVSRAGARLLLDSVRRADGTLADDTTVVLCRRWSDE